MPASAILLLDTDPASEELIAELLARLGHRVTTVRTGDEAVLQAPDHQLAILDVVAGAKSAADVCREIRGTPSISHIPVLCISQTDRVEERIGFLEAGADDVMAKPFDARELEARVEALLVRVQRSKALGPTDKTTVMRARRTVVVFSPKGGAGTTTIATNVAMAQAQRKPDKVVLVDLHLQFGQVVTHLNMEPKHSLGEVVRDDAALREPELLRTYAMRHDSGLHVLAAPGNPELAATIEPRHVEQLLQTLLGSYELVAVDAGSVLDERSLTAFERADTVILAVHPEISALNALKALIEYLTDTGSVMTKAEVVLNNMFARDILKMRDIEGAIGAKVSTELPYDPFLYLKAVNEGVPLVRAAPRSPAAQRLVALSDLAFGEDAQAAPRAGRTEPKQRGLTGILRRS